MNANLRTILRLVGALAVLAGGLLHFKVWNDVYKEIPSGQAPGLWVVKIGFPVQAAASVLLAVLMIFVRRPIVWAAAVLLDIGSVLALVLSRKASLFGWKEIGWGGDVRLILISEVAAVVVISVLLAMDFQRVEAENDLATY